jgi:hypothetical protein
VLRFAAALGLAAACASGTPTALEAPERCGPVYKPGQSIAESRLCACEDCIDRTCCAGERDGQYYADAETNEAGELVLGMTLPGCGRCVRRVWTVRGAESCASLAGPQCCPGTVSD